MKNEKLDGDQETAIVPTTETTTAIPQLTADLIKKSFPQSPTSPLQSQPVWSYLPEYPHILDAEKYKSRQLLQSTACFYDE